MRILKLSAAGAAALVVAATLVSCASPAEVANDNRECDGVLPETTTLTVWYHDGEAPDTAAMTEIAAEFNASQDEVEVDLRFIADYSNAVRGAAASNELPDVLDADASNAANYAWSGYTRPLDSCIPDELRQDLLPSIVSGGTYADQQYGLGFIDSGLAMYADREALDAAGVRIPSGYEDAWSADEFEQALLALRASGYEQPLDIGKNSPNPYVTEPFLWSAGGDLIDRETYETADGVINSEDAVAGLTQVQNWVKDGLVDDNTDSSAFVNGRSALSWSGFWDYSEFSEAYGDRLVALPMPDLGAGSMNAQGSWQWTMTDNEKDPDAQWAWIAWTMKPENVERVTGSISGVPGLQSLLETNELYGPDAPLAVIGEGLAGGSSLPRPMHPGYPAMEAAWVTAITDIINGRDVQEALDTAAAQIDEDLELNEMYPEPE